MPSTTAGTLIVRIIGDTREWGRSARGFQAQLLSLQNVAKAAFAAFAADSVRAGLAVDQTFTRIAALTNTSAAQLGRWRDVVSQLSEETGRSVQELGGALYFLASSGLSASQVNEALEVTAKAAAVGLGQSADIARIVSQALNAYSDSGLTATEVTDTLVAAVREGTAEPEEFAAALGRILPIASRAGVEFDELTASLAVLSNIGLDVNEGVTAMRGLLQALVAPGTQAAEAMASVGISAEEMRRVISEEGILGALRLLERRTGGNLDLMRKIVPNIRALTGALGISGQEAEKVAGQYQAVRDATGSLDRAMRITAQSASFRFARALNDIRQQGMELGSKVLPLLADALGFAADHFAELATAIGSLWVASKVRVLLLALVSALEKLATVVEGKVALAITSKLIPALSGLRTALAGGWAGAFVVSFGLLAQKLREASDEAERFGRQAGLTADQVDTFTVAGRSGMNVTLLQARAYDEAAGAARALANEVMAMRWEAMGRAAEAAGRDVLGVADASKVAGKALQVFAGMTAEELKKWQGGIRDNLRDVSDDLAQLADDGRVTATEIMRSLREQANALADYARNWETVNRRGLPDELARQIAEMGDDGALILQALANASKRQFDRIVADFKRAQSEARRVAAAIDGIGRSIQGLPSSATVAVDVQRKALAAGAGGHGVQVQPAAHGGIFTRPTLALIGEAGPEAVIPLNRAGDARTFARELARELRRVRLTVDRRRFRDAIDAEYAYGVR